MPIKSQSRPAGPSSPPPRLAAPDTAAPARREPGDDSARSSVVRRLGIALVAGAYAATQLSSFDVGRALDWDESVYLSQVLPSVEPLPFAASRARGIVALIWPLAVASTPLEVIRFSLIVLSAVALYLAFRLWEPVIGGGSVVAAAVFAFAWPTLFYGSEIYPNLWSGLAGVAAAGGLARWLQVPGRRWLAVSASAFAVMALMRPIDAALAAVAAAAVLVVVRRRGTLLAIASIAAGCIVGVLPWIAEALTRYGSIQVALREAQGAVDVGGRGNAVVHEHLLLADGPLFGLDPDPAVSGFAAGWWLGLLLLSVFSVTVASSTHRWALLIPAFMGTALAGFYLTFDGAFAPRFLLPAYALLSVSAGAALSGVVWRPGLGRKLVYAAGAVAFVPLAAWGIGVANDLESNAVGIREGSRVLAGELKELAGPQCSFASQFGAPEISVHSSCRGSRFIPGAPVPPDVDVILARIPPGDPSVAACAEATTSALEGWYLHDCRAS